MSLLKRLKSLLIPEVCVSFTFIFSTIWMYFRMCEKFCNMLCNMWLTLTEPNALTKIVKEHRLGIHGFRLTRSYLIIEFLASFFGPSVSCAVINCAFTFCTANVFVWFLGVTVKFDQVHLCSFQITHRIKQYIYIYIRSAINKFTVFFCTGI